MLGYAYSHCVFSVFLCLSFCRFFFFKQKTAYEMRISDWSSDVCSSDLWSLSMSADEVLRVLRDHAVPAGRIYSAIDMINDPHYHARQMIHTMTEDRKSVV